MRTRILCLITWLFFTLTACTPLGTETIGGSCAPTDQDQYIYHPDRLEVKAACLRVTGIIVSIKNEADGDDHIRLNLDDPYKNLLTAANDNQQGDLVIEPVCYHTATQADAIGTCQSDSDPFSDALPAVGQHVWMEGRYVLDNDHGGWAELHPLYRWGPVN